MTRVALLWHMHQPFYQDILTGEHVLPWVRLHALKDYWGMVALLREFPGVRLTFNLVPSLLVQLETFARGEARDRHLELSLKPAEELTLEERAFCVEQFFHAHRLRMIEPYPRYRDLMDRLRGERGVSARARVSHFSVEDLRDLQVWHKLAWIDPAYHDRPERVRALVAKGERYSEYDKRLLREVELELLRKVIPEYAAAAARGQVELSTSPFYHPILPLLCDSDVYLTTHPHARTPREPFRHPEDAAEHLARAVALHERLFGHRPLGLWPSEGSVSDAILPLVADAGFRWMATDEEILSRTLGLAFTRTADGHLEQPERLYRPYSVGAGHGAVACGFRDHTLSDLIGFTYASWPADAAAADFTDRIVAAGRHYAAQTGGEDATVFVILDGENAWEHYDGQGRPFLRALYGRLETHPEISTVTMAEACAAPDAALPSIFPGSWINGDFYIWIGHPDDHRAWSQLAAARRALDAAAPSAPPAAVARAREEMLVAEGSDWFWWYGDDHSSEHDLAFDDLFRRHVRNVYRALDKPVPEDLFVTNITTAPPVADVEAPTGFISPDIDGRVTSYFEWIGAGCVELALIAGTMHEADERAAGLRLLEFGFGLEALFVRMDSEPAMRGLLVAGWDVVIRFLEPGGYRLVVRRTEREDATSAASDVSVQLEVRGGDIDIDCRPVACEGLAAAAGEILELRIPFSCLGVGAGARVAFVVGMLRGGVEIEHYPRHRPVEVEVPDGRFTRRVWTA